MVIRFLCCNMSPSRFFSCPLRSHYSDPREHSRSFRFALAHNVTCLDLHSEKGSTLSSSGQLASNCARIVRCEHGVQADSLPLVSSALHRIGFTPPPQLDVIPHGDRLQLRPSNSTVLRLYQLPGGLLPHQQRRRGGVRGRPL